ncbi:LysR family transcriptional regulator [Luteolibacter luteus]|uniref:LysR family transcriptional regulator n=1 Tax=Luteolibacter luteus TaxID=2728835 RepID=A0A858RFS8_9BACT|nr:LysR family transcriptional regulator [Luteolibacter luteus]QJE94993.1 LysR family transcriptional regulator [Luteolibacter luteus]
MELRHLRYFVAVAEEENVTRAAARLHVAQPSLSRQIRDLEHELGVDLFDHAVRSVRLTAAGRHFLGEAREAIARIEQATRSVQEFVHGAAGELHIGYAPSLSTTTLPRALRLFLGRYPKVQAQLHDLSTEEMIAGIRAGSLDVALIAKTSEHPWDGVEFREIARHRPAVALPPSHNLAKADAIDLKSLGDQSLLAYGRTQYPEYHAWLQQVFGEKAVPKIAGEYDSSSSLIASVESGCGIALVQEGFETLAGSRLSIRPIKGLKGAGFSFGVAFDPKKASPKIEAFITSCQEAIDPEQTDPLANSR